MKTKIFIVAIALSLTSVMSLQAQKWERALTLNRGEMACDFYATQSFDGSILSGSIHTLYGQIDWRYHTSEHFSIGPSLSIGYYTMSMEQIYPILAGVSMRKTIGTIGSNNCWQPYVKCDLLGGVDFAYFGAAARLTPALGIEYNLSANKGIFAEATMNVMWVGHYDFIGNTAGISLGMRF